MDDQTVALLQWALPPLRLRWARFRKVRRQVCKRVARRIQVLQLQDVAVCRDYLQHHRFDLILCRNLAFTYFDEALQRQTLQHLHEMLRREACW